MTRKKLILHVGFTKTATTSIQNTLSRNTKLLKEQGIYYPNIVRWPSKEYENHGNMFISLFSEQPEKLHLIYTEQTGNIGAVNAAYREQFDGLFARENSTIIISGEEIANQSPKLLEKIESAIRRYGWSIEVIASIRSPLSALVSAYSTITKMGLKSSSTIAYRPSSAAFRRLKNLHSAFDTVRTYPFSEACRHPRGPVGYFLDFLRIENTDAYEPIKKNKAISNNAVRLLMYVNGFEPTILDDKKNPNRSRYDLKALWAIPGPKFRLTREEYEAVREHVEFENAWLESNLGREYCDDEIELRRSDVHWDEESLRAVREALPEVPGVLVPYVRRYFEEEQGIVLTQDTVVPGLPECRPALERPEEVVRSVDERLRAGQLDEVSAIALLRSATGGDEGDRLLYDRACELLLQSGKSQEAIRLAEEGLARFGGDLALMSRLGYAYQAWGGMEGALVQWAKVRQAHPSAEAGWIEGAICSASLGFGNEACELLGAYLVQREDRLSRPWWTRVLRITESILFGYSENRYMRGLLEALFLRPVAPDLAAHVEIFHILNRIPDYLRLVHIIDLLKDIYRCFPIRRDDDRAVVLDLALAIAVEHENPGFIKEFLARISFQEFCGIFEVRCRPAVQVNFLRERGDIQEMIAALPVTDPDNARKCLSMRYALGMDYSAAYEALTGSVLPTAREGYSDFAFAVYAGNGRPKVAFCISGQLRDYREAFAGWRKSRLFADCDVSAFVHTWPEVGAIRLHPNKMSRVFGGKFLLACIKEYSVIEGKWQREKIDKFEKAYPNLVRTVTESQVVSAAELAEFYETPYIVVESEELYRDYSNTEKMYYKTRACWELACAEGDEFHFAFCVRPDLTLRDDSKVDWCEIVAQSQNEKIAYVKYLRFMTSLYSGFKAGLAVEDKLGFGNPAAMAVYSNTWNRMKDPNGLIRAYSGHDRWHFGHIALALNLVEHEVKSAPYPEGLVLGGLLNTKRPSLYSLRGALEKDLTPDNRCQNPLWRALEKDISCEVENEKR